MFILPLEHKTLVKNLMELEGVIIFYLAESDIRQRALTDPPDTLSDPLVFHLYTLTSI